MQMQFLPGWNEKPSNNNSDKSIVSTHNVNTKVDTYCIPDICCTVIIQLAQTTKIKNVKIFCLVYYCTTTYVEGITNHEIGNGVNLQYLRVNLRIYGIIENIHRVLINSRKCVSLHILCRNNKPIPPTLTHASCSHTLCQLHQRKIRPDIRYSYSTTFNSTTTATLWCTIVT